MNILLISRFVTGWIIACCILLGFIINSNDPFFSFGPNENLIFIGITINTTTKYVCLIIYCFLNTIIRAIIHNILQPWIIFNIQDSTNKNPVNNAYEIVTLNNIYTWFDWFIYINLLLAQIDMIIIESLSEIIINNIITYTYIRDKKIIKDYEILLN